MSDRAINFRQKLSLFREQWQPKGIAQMNDYRFKLVRIDGDFVEGGARSAPNEVWI